MTMYRVPMGSDTAALLRQALALPDGEREDLAMELLASLPESVDDGLSDEWIGEVERRIEQVESGAVVCEEWDAVEQRLLAKFPPA